jgi:hypothetical protein
MNNNDLELGCVAQTVNLAKFNSFYSLLQICEKSCKRRVSRGWRRLSYAHIFLIGRKKGAVGQPTARHSI